MSVEEENQLALPVTVKNRNVIAVWLNKFFLYYRFTSFFQLTQNFFLWTAVGLVGVVFFSLIFYADNIQSGIGNFPYSTVKSLSLVYTYFYGMITLLVFAIFVSLNFISFGKGTLVNYLFLIVIMFFLLVIKTVFLPILFLQ